MEADKTSCNGCCCNREKKEEKGGESFTDFTQETSMHGIKYVTIPNTSLATKLLWLLALLIMIAYAVGASYDLISALIRKETTTKLKNTRVDSLQFPSIVICDHNGFEKSRVDEAIIKHNLTGLDTLLLEMYAYRSGTNWSLPEYQNLNDLSSADWENLLFSLTPPPESSILNAMFGGVVLTNITAEFQRIITDQGACHLFNGDGRHISLFNGIYSGLMVTMSANVDSYWMGPLAGKNGFTVAIYEQGFVPQIVADGYIGFTPGTSIDVVISQTQYSRHPPPADNNTANCYDTETEPNTLIYYPKYTYNGCVMECNTRFKAKMCGCRSFFDPPLEGIDVCKPEKLISCITRIDWSKSLDFALENNCACQVPCKEVQYSVQTAVYQSPNAANVLAMFGSNDFVTWQRDNMLVAKIAYQSLSYNTIEEKKAYSVTDVVANLGGTLGVCVGASALTFCEFIQFLLQTASRRIRYWSSKRSGSVVHVTPAPPSY